MTTKRKVIKMKIAFIGGGNMGEAILAAMLGKKLAINKNIAISDVSEARRTFLAQKYAVNVSASNIETINGKDIILLAIKPQTLPAVMAEMKGHIKPEQLVISIIAGARLNKLTEGFGHKAIVRSMPNTPAQIGEGVTMWTNTPEVSEAQKKTAASILGAMGKEFYAVNEGMLDMATAVSGSGPAYVFLYIEAMTEAAVKIGLPRNEAKQMVMGTLLGSAHLAAQSDKEPAELRRMVTSPGGTTAEAIATFEKGNFSELVYQAVKAAYEKSQKLGQG
jgi:pyrroline-5-carboxylate reductase